MTYFRDRFDFYRQMFMRPRKALQALFYCTLRSIGAEAESVTVDMLKGMADAWEDDNGPATWEKVEGYAAGLDDSRQLLTPLSHPAIKTVVEGLTQIGRDHGVKGTIFANAVLDPRHGRVVASLVFDLWEPDEVPLWEPDQRFTDRIHARVHGVALEFAEAGTGGVKTYLRPDIGLMAATAVFTLKGWNDKPQAAAETAPVELTKVPPKRACTSGPGGGTCDDCRAAADRGEIDLDGYSLAPRANGVAPHKAR